jgi:hypothetical protein
MNKTSPPNLIIAMLCGLFSHVVQIGGVFFFMLLKELGFLNKKNI